MCLEFVDPPQLVAPLQKVADKCKDTESTTSCIASPIYYVQVEKEDPSNNPFAAAIIYSNGHPSLEPNPLPFREGAMRSSSCSIATQSLALPTMTPRPSAGGVESSKGASSLSSEQNDRNGQSTQSSDQQRPIPSSYIVHQQMLNSLPDVGYNALANGVLRAGDELVTGSSVKTEEPAAVIRTGSEPSFVHSKVSDAMSSPLFAIVPSLTTSYPDGFADNDISGGGGICALDNKIEQAMDLVKSHLMFAVHEEVELLKEQIKELTIKKGQLEYENKVLRASATQETLEKLQHGVLSPSTSLS